MTDPQPTNPRRRALLVVTSLIAVLLLVAPLWTLTASKGAVIHQHWTLAALMAVSFVAGVVLAIVTIRAWRRGSSPTTRYVALKVIGLVLLTVVAATVMWLTPFPATQDALDALESDHRIQVTETAGWYAFTPQEVQPTAGLVYTPGARVDVRATATVLRPLAEEGYLVVVLKPPLGIALTSINQSASAIGYFDQVDSWAVGGHSLGGVAASSFAHTHEVNGLLLHGSYPIDDMSGQDLQVVSAWGSEDGLTTASDIENSRAKLPPATDFVEISGGVHAFFADYGIQPGDGTPTISRQDAQRQIADANKTLMDAVAELAN